MDVESETREGRGGEGESFRSYDGLKKTSLSSFRFSCFHRETPLGT